MLFLGISDLDHDTAACLMGGDGLIAAVEEDKLTRSASTGLPQAAIARCLDKAGSRAVDAIRIGVACRPRRAWLRDEGGRQTTFVSPEFSTRRRDAQDSLFWKLNQLREL